EFQGVFDRHTKMMHLFERTIGGQFVAPVSIGGISDPVIRERLDDQTFKHTTEELEMLELAGETFDEQAVLAGKTTPVFFGSAINNFGVQLLLDGFLANAPAPVGRKNGITKEDSDQPTGQNGSPSFITPEHPAFSGFIFKIQANMDPKHRDRIAFVRVCSGKFERDRTEIHPRTEKKVRLSSSHKLFGNEREVVNEACPGHLIALDGHWHYGVRDTL